MQETTLEIFKNGYNMKLAAALDWITSNEPGPVPLLIQEILTNAEIFYFGGILLNGVILILVCFIFVKCHKLEKYWMLFPFVVGIVFSILFFCYSLYQFIMINYAPKIWLAENIQYCLLH